MPAEDLRLQHGGGDGAAARAAEGAILGAENRNQFCMTRISRAAAKDG